jgi:VCBS repeat-containing protein
MSEIMQFNTIAAGNQPMGIRLAESMSQSEQDRQTLEDLVRSIDPEHPAVPLLKALATGENPDQAISAILSDNIGITSELAPFLLKYFKDSLLLSLKNGAEFDVALERAIDMTQSVADTWTSDIDQQILPESDAGQEFLADNVIEVLPDSEFFQDALDKTLQRLYTDKLELGTEPVTELPMEAVTEALNEQDVTATGPSDGFLEEILNKLVQDLEADIADEFISEAEDEYESYVQEDFALESLDSDDFAEINDDSAAPEAIMGPSSGTTSMGFTGPTTSLSPTLASYAPPASGQISPYDVNRAYPGLNDGTIESNPPGSEDVIFTSSSGNNPPNLSGNIDSGDIAFDLPKKLISVFAYPNLNGEDATGDTTDNETKNVFSIVQKTINDDKTGDSDGFDLSDHTLTNTIKNFGTYFDSELNKCDVFLIPDLAGETIGDKQNGIDYPESSKLALQNWVNDGGTLIMSGSDNGANNDLYTTADFLNSTFNWDLRFVESKGDNSGHEWTLNSSNAEGTSFEGNPSSLPLVTQTTSIGAGSVANFIPIYGTASDAAVALISYGKGQVIFLGHDFNNSGFAGTGIAGGIEGVKQHYDTDVKSGGSNDSVWVQEIIPSALAYSQSHSVSGSLTVEDQDSGDTVSVSVASVTYTGDTDGFDLNNDQLLSLMKVTGGLGADAKAATIGWSFSTGLPDNFSHLDPGESMTLTYAIRATDSRGASDDNTITITLEGSEDGRLLADFNNDDRDNYDSAGEHSDIKQFDSLISEFANTDHVFDIIQINQLCSIQSEAGVMTSSDDCIGADIC